MAGAGESLLAENIRIFSGTPDDKRSLFTIKSGAIRAGVGVGTGSQSRGEGQAVLFRGEEPSFQAATLFIPDQTAWQDEASRVAADDAACLYRRARPAETGLYPVKPVSLSASHTAKTGYPDPHSGQNLARSQRIRTRRQILTAGPSSQAQKAWRQNRERTIGIF